MHQVVMLDGVLAVRLDSRSNVQDVYKDIRIAIESQSAPFVVILDFTSARVIDQNLKAMFYRVFQHNLISRIGICGVNMVVARDVNDLIGGLQRIRRVTIGETEADIRRELGLSIAGTQERKLSGMLAYLKQSSSQEHAV